MGYATETHTGFPTSHGKGESSGYLFVIVNITTNRSTVDGDF